AESEGFFRVALHWSCCIPSGGTVDKLLNPRTGGGRSLERNRASRPEFPSCGPWPSGTAALRRSPSPSRPCGSRAPCLSGSRRAGGHKGRSCTSREECPHRSTRHHLPGLPPSVQLQDVRQRQLRQASWLSGHVTTPTEDTAEQPLRDWLSGLW